MKHIQKKKKMAEEATVLACIVLLLESVDSCGASWDTIDSLLIQSSLVQKENALLHNGWELNARINAGNLDCTVQRCPEDVQVLVGLNLGWLCVWKEQVLFSAKKKMMEKEEKKGLPCFFFMIPLTLPL